MNCDSSRVWGGLSGPFGKCHGKWQVGTAGGGGGGAGCGDGGGSNFRWWQFWCGRFLVLGQQECDGGLVVFC